MSSTHTWLHRQGYCSLLVYSKVMCTVTLLQGKEEKTEGLSQGLCLSLSHTHMHTEREEVVSRWYSQSFSVAGDIPWHGSETQSMAVHCGATAGTQGRAGTGVAHEQGREHHHPHPERLPGQLLHACPKTISSNWHIRTNPA